MNGKKELSEIRIEDWIIVVGILIIIVVFVPPTPHLSIAGTILSFGIGCCLILIGMVWRFKIWRIKHLKQRMSD